MNLSEIEANLKNPDFEYRLKAVKALKDHDSEVAVPILTDLVNDSEFLVRSFVAMALGKQQTTESFTALMQIMKLDNTPNVRAEAANSLSLFGRISVSHLVLAFYKDDHWLVRRSILGALVEMNFEMNCPEAVLDVCMEALKGEDASVAESAVDALGTLANSTKRDVALSQLLALVNHQSEHMRLRVAYALEKFDEPQAKQALAQLRTDDNHQVVGAALEDLLKD
ncbi:MAG: HEAT repeat domain-containing protein [Rivularia sp. ALOHA_DT_140]|nr:HEAT repeat domain-containing protein [Rivularia sp. ALOHA_DT_140]